VSSRRFSEVFVIRSPPFGGINRGLSGDKMAEKIAKTMILSGFGRELA